MSVSMYFFIQTLNQATLKNTFYSIVSCQTQNQQNKKAQIGNLVAS